MNPGAFSISLAVKDLQKSRLFYEKIGFSMISDTSEQKYLIMKNGTSIIGLFQGMFQNNIMTFNPGWDQDAKNIDPFTDVREIQKQLKASGIAPGREADENGNGPDYFIITDPDGNTILFDQHR